MVLAVVYTCLFVVVPTVLLLALHSQQWGFNLVHALLLLFSSINFMIAVWEISLHLNVDWIKARYDSLKAKTPAHTLPPIFMFQDVSVSEALSLKYWANVWLLYCFFDSSYAYKKSYGFWIDSGNGFSTLVPTVLFAVGCTYDVLSPRHLGIMGLLLFYQEFYGTVLYFSSFMYNKRYQEHKWEGKLRAYVLAFVFAVNVVWMVFPALGMYACYSMVMDDNMLFVRAA